MKCALVFFQLRHQSLVFISDCLEHSPAAVFAIMTATNHFLDEEDQEITDLQWVSDGAGGQYKNNRIVFVVANHRTLYGRAASWSYNITGHGKGGVDGIGATVSVYMLS